MCNISELIESKSRNIVNKSVTMAVKLSSPNNFTDPQIEQEKHVIVPEVCNVYKYRGKLWQFHEERNNESKKKDTDSTINLSYKDFIKKNKNN